MKSSKIIIIVVLVIGVIVGILALFMNSLKKDQLETKKIMNTIVDKYDRFEDKVLTFNDIRDNVYKEIFQDTYYDTIKENYESFNTKMKELETHVDVVMDESKQLKKYCSNYYSDSSVNNKCTIFKELYEEVVNSFVSDIDKYNELLGSYNKYLEENGNSEESLVLYKSNKKYIDFNEDKEFSGKE